MGVGRKSAKSDYKLRVFRIITKTTLPGGTKQVPLMPHGFQISEKNVEKNKWETLPNIEYGVWGDLTRISFDTGEYNGEVYNVVKLSIVDRELKENYLLDLRMTHTSRNIFNSLLALKEFDDIEISLYKKEASDGNVYSNVALRQNGELIKGLFKSEELPKPNIITNSKGQVIKREYDELDDFYLKELEKLAATLESRRGGKSKSPEKKEENIPQPVPASDLAEDTDNDVPF